MRCHHTAQMSPFVSVACNTFQLTGRIHCYPSHQTPLTNLLKTQAASQWCLCLASVPTQLQATVKTPLPRWPRVASLPGKYSSQPGRALLCRTVISTMYSIHQHTFSIGGQPVFSPLLTHDRRYRRSQGMVSMKNWRRSPGDAGANRKSLLLIRPEFCVSVAL